MRSPVVPFGLAAPALALVLGCGAPAPSPTAPSAGPPPPATAGGVPPAAAATQASQPQTACSPRTPRAVKVASRSGGSIALVEDGGRSLIYVADEDNRAVHVIDADGPAELAVTELPGRPAQLLPLPDGRILVTLRDKNRLLALEPGARPEEGLETRCERPTYTEPWGLALSVDGGRVALTAGWDHRLMLLEARGLETERVIDIPPEPRAVLLSGDGDSIYVAHMIGGIVSKLSLSRPQEPPRSTFLRPERPPRPEKTKAKGAARGPEKAKEPEKTQDLAAAQGFALAELSLGSDGGRAWPARVFVPMASSDPMRFAADNTFPAVYGGGGAGPAVIGAFVAVLDPATGTPLGGEVAPLRRSRPEDCILPRGIAVHRERLLVTCLGTDALMELDARAADPVSAQRRRLTVDAGPTGVAVDNVRERAFVFSQWSGAVTVIDLAESSKIPAQVLKLARPQTPSLSAKLSRGRELFHLTRDVRMSFDGRACASCHPDGRADGLTWATPDGPRQTILLAGRVEGSGPYGWFGDHPTSKDHVSFTVGRLGGHGFQTAADKEDFDAMMAYVASLPVPSREGALTDEGVPALRARGRELFLSSETGCSSCHLGDAGDGRRHDVGSGDAREKRVSFDTPALRLVAGAAPYFHDGRYRTLMDLLSDPKSKMGRSAQLNQEDRRALAAYLESL